MSHAVRGRLKNGFCRTAILEAFACCALFAIVALICRQFLACQAVGEALKRHRCGNRQRQTLCCRQAVAAQAMAGVVFQDDFEVAQINPEGAKFEKVNRLVCKGVVYEIEFLIDVNSELFECEEGDKLTVALATSLSVDGVSEAKAIDYARGAKASLLDQFDYAMHGTVYKFQHVKDTKVEVYVSHGGLLARFRGDQRHLKKLKVDAEVYTLLRKGSA